ncbi:MAG: hypothetical protein KKE56_07565 [Actinobacteria bacterium]|nr:hypothetical protein [Actinomycetota bacterium]
MHLFAFTARDWNAAGDVAIGKAGSARASTWNVSMKECDDNEVPEH